MTTPRKRPSVKNKKTARPAARAAAASSSVAPSVSAPSGNSVDAPVASADEARAASSSAATLRTEDDAVGQGNSVASFGFEKPSQPGVPSPGFLGREESGPKDDFDLGDEALPSGRRQPARPNAKARSRARKTVRGNAGKAAGGAGESASADRSARSSGASSGRVGGAASRVDRSSAEKAKRPRPGGKRGIIAAVVGVLVAIAVAAGGFFVWDTYFRYDDSADIQGEWRTQDSSMTVVIDATDIRMPDLEYSYEIDEGSKKLKFSFSDLSGSGSYSFSADRNTLTIVEGEGESAATTVLVRVSDNTEATPHLLDGDTASETGEDAGTGKEGSESGAEADGGTEGEGASSDSSGGSSSTAPNGEGARSEAE